jgi:glucosamine--fructose-6-phosphate aminotransferase (isomerizing)
MLPYTQSILFLDEHEVAVVSRSGIKLFDADGNPRKPQFQQIAWAPVQAEKGGHKHFMLKEIIEQPTAVANTVLGRLSQDTEFHLDKSLSPTNREEPSRSNSALVPAGTRPLSETMIESLAECRLKWITPAGFGTAIIAFLTVYLSSSLIGETADTISAQRLVVSRSKILTITNVVIRQPA